MNHKIKIALALVTAIAASGTIISVLGSEAALMDRFPDIDPKIVVKAHRKMFFAALRGEVADDPSDEGLDALFLEHVRQITIDK